MHISGHCHCKQISFQATIDPTHVVACHCTDCQTMSGAPFRTIVPVPADQLHLQGTPQTYIKVAESGNRRLQAFCGHCGTHLYSSEPDHPQIFFIRLGCVTERALLPPQRQIWGRSRLPWLQNLAQVPCYSQGLASELVNSGGLGLNSKRRLITDD